MPSEAHEGVRLLRGILTLMICLFLTGGHYGMLQCVAWAGMLWSYSEQDGLLQGAQDTFSGEKPCCMCKAIAKAKESETDPQQPMSALGLEKLKDLQCPSVARLKPLVGEGIGAVEFGMPARLWALWLEAPLPPPPRVQV